MGKVTIVYDSEEGITAEHAGLPIEGVVSCDFECYPPDPEGVRPKSRLVLAIEGANVDIEVPEELVEKRHEGLSPGALSILSEREQEVALAIGRGMRAKEIGRDFVISPHTVRNHLKAIYRKLGISSQYELIRKVMGA